MKRSIVKFSFFAAVVTIAGIAIAQNQYSPEEAVVLLPPPANRTVENTGNQPVSDARHNPLRGRQTVVAGTSKNGMADLSGQSYPNPAAADPFRANMKLSSGATSSESRTNEMVPIRRTAYDAAAADTINGPALVPTPAPPEGSIQNQSGPLADNDATANTYGEYGIPAMASPQSDLASTAAAAPHRGGEDYGYTQPGEPARSSAELNERPQNPTPALVGSLEPYDASRGYSQAAPALEDPRPDSNGDTSYDSPSSAYGSPSPVYNSSSSAYGSPSSTAEPARLTASREGHQPAPIDRYESSERYGNSDRYGGSDRRYTSSQPNQNELSRDDRYPAIQPTDTRSAPAQSSGPAGVGRPARDEGWDGEQTPHLRVVKVAPKEIQVGKPATFRVEIENVGRVMAHGVEVRDQIPQSTRLIDTTPASVADSHGGLVWQLGKLKPGEKTSVEMKLMPTDEGNEIGSVAMVRFGTPASVRTVATRPMLEVEVITEDQVMVESDMTLTIRVSNPGSGAATGVVLEERIPQGLQHPAGAELEYEVGDLAPKASKTIQLKLAAIRPGVTKNVLIARAEGLDDVVKESDIEVVAPALKVAMQGPRSRYLNRKASYEVSISNPGSAAARDVRLVATLPPGLKFVEANNNGHYDPSSRTVRWALAELPVNETGTVRLTALPVEMGDHAVRIQGTADRAVAVKQEQKIAVDGIAALRFEVVDVNDPIEIGAETAYEIRVLNQGTKDASNVVVQATLPPGLELIAAEGPGSLRHSVQNGRVVFEPIRRLAPKVDTSFRIRVRGRQAGDQRLRVELNSDYLRNPVVKEESTRVFGDQ